MASNLIRENGLYGEKLTLHLLLKQGFTLVAKNYHSTYGEIDIIMIDGETLAFVEVKTRSQNSAIAQPIEFVTKGKQRKIIKTAKMFLMDNPQYQEYYPRFDVAEVLLTGGNPLFRYTKNAFYQDDNYYTP